ncbi:MAG: hypothetical protein ACW99G_04935 [Candidatus Thorarchaeota archaeon]|jgi:hypothetical protein
MRKEIWYSVHNGGDGSAYPVFMESEAQVKIDQRNQDEGWGEPCYGKIVVDSDSDITVVNHVITIDEQLKYLEDELNSDYLQAYKAEGKYKGWWMRLERHIAALKELKQE